MEKKEGKICIIHCGFDIPEGQKEQLLDHLKVKNSELALAIKEFETGDLNGYDLEKDEEIFERLDNILVTEKGYYCAVWEDDLEIVEED